MAEQPREDKNILIFGHSGSGKSLLCNILLGKDQYEDFHISDSTARHFDQSKFNWHYNPSSKVRIFDYDGDVTQESLKNAFEKLEQEKYELNTYKHNTIRLLEVQVARFSDLIASSMLSNGVDLVIMK